MASGNTDIMPRDKVRAVEVTHESFKDKTAEVTNKT